MNRQLQKIFLVFILALMQTLSVSYAESSLKAKLLQNLSTGFVDSSIEVELSMQHQDGYFSTDQLILDVTLTNVSKDEVTFLKWETPFENDFTGNMLTIQHEGEEVSYIGKIVKRAPPEEGDFITLAAGETISTSIDISQGYAIEHRGDYTVAFNKHLHIANRFATKSSSDVALKSVAVRSPTMNFKLHEERHVVQLAKQANFSSCSGSQQNILNEAQAAAITIAEEARDTLNNTAASQRPTAERYVTWFGRHTSDRYSTVVSHFTKIHDGLANQQVSFLCECNIDNRKNTFAFVFPNREYDIHLCDAFWRADLNGTDSQAGTLVHEMSHFIIVAGTKDHIIGVNAAKNLAASNSINAISSADNLEYFAENTPKLSMESNGSATGNTGDDTTNDTGTSSSGSGGGGYLSIGFLSFLLAWLGLLRIRKVCRSNKIN